MATPVPSPDQTWQLLSALAASAAFVRRGTEEHPHDAVTLRLLALAEERKRLHPSDITAALELSPPAVTRRVRALVQAGHLTARPDPSDARAYFVEITTGGRQYLTGFRAELSERFTVVLQDWTAEDVATLVALLNRLNENMSRHQPAQDSPASKTWWRTGLQPPG